MTRPPEKAELIVWAAEAEWVGADRSMSCKLAMNTAAKLSA